MSTPYLGQISVYAFGFAPNGFALCNGQIMSINQNQALFALLGTTYGGNGVQTFALPNLQGRVPISSNSTFTLGAYGGQETHTLLDNEMPSHSHPLVAAGSAASQTAAPGNFPAVSADDLYSTASPTSTLGAGTNSTGGSQPHENRQPYLTINFCIALTGIFPSRS